MKSDYSHVTFVLDNSGSMQVIKEQTIAGFNTFLEKQKSDPGTMTFSLYQFTNRVFPVASAVAVPSQVNTVAAVYPGVPSAIKMSLVQGPGLNVKCVHYFIGIQSVAKLNDDTYKCETGTPLLDAMGTAILETGKKLADLPESERPSKVFMVILTDGEENESYVYTHAKVMEMIKHQQEVYGWDFVFLGANQDAIAVGGGYGISSSSSMTYRASAAGVQASYSATSDAITRSKISGEAVNFTNAERNAALDQNGTT